MRGGGAQARLRTALADVAQAAIDWLDEIDAHAEALEDDEGEVASEDDGVVDAMTWGQWG